jgi:hypothetical protein
LKFKKAWLQIIGAFPKIIAGYFAWPKSVLETDNKNFSISTFYVLLIILIEA